MDIRNWLQPVNKKTAESKKRRIEDDEDVIPGSPDVQIINKKKKPSGITKDKNKSMKDKPLKEVKAVDLFGNGPIKRTEPIVKKAIKKTETEIHSDDDLEKSLLEIDDLDLVDSDETDQKKQKSDADPSVKIEKPDIESSSKKESKDHDKSKKSPNKPKDETEHSSSKKSHQHLHSKKFDEIKRDIKETNKRKFAEFIEDEEDTNKNTSIENNVETNEANGCVTKTENHDVTANDSILEDLNGTKHKKRRVSKSHNESVLTDEERHERKMYSAKLYQSYLNRSGPKHLGTKEMPEGAPNCLKDFAILLTGVLDSFERDEIVDTITKYGGCVKNSISKKVTHVLAGEDAGPAKMAKAQELGVKIINEDEFLKIIKESKTKIVSDKDVKNDKDHNRKSSKDRHEKERKKSPKDKHSVNESTDEEDQKNSPKDKQSINGSRHEKERKKSPKDKQPVNGTSSKDKIEQLDTQRHKSEHHHNKDNIKKEHSEKKHSRDSSKNKLEIKEQNRAKSKNPMKTDVVETKQNLKSESGSKSTRKSKSPAKCDVVKIEKNIKSESESSTEMNKVNESKSSADLSQTNSKISGTMWVEKYKPQNVKQIIGQLGESSNVNKLINWLTKWYVNRKAKLPKPSPWAKNDDGGFYKAVLLSGPPGVGKTTTVALVCKQLGFDMVEFNASDTRNKTLIKEQIGELLTTTSLSTYAKGETGKQAVTKKHVLVMDEVDGMAGNEDRGGLQELIGLIKSTSVPIICMCNDRNSQKMRSLVNYCYDLRFNRPKVEQIKAAMRSICCKENIKIPPDVLGQLIVSANQDVRQTLNLLSMWAIDPSRMDHDRLSKDAAVTKKDVKLGPWEAIRKVFSAEDHKTMSINDKSDLFFYDYSLSPLFVQENYLQVQPHCPKHEVLKRLSEAADSIAFGDTIEKRIRSSQAWSLLPMQAMYSSVVPGHLLSGHMTGQIQFPGWLGKNSRANKMQRLCQEIHAHTRLSTTGSKSSIFLDYSSHLRDAIVTPLIKDRADGIEQALQVLESYNLLREDLDSLVELSVWPGQRNPTVLIDSKVKAAMTRTYNKKAAALPYAVGAIKRARTREDDDGFPDEDTVDDEEPDSDPENDMLIKKKKSQHSEKASSSSDKPSTSKGKSSNKGTNPTKGKKK